MEQRDIDVEPVGDLADAVVEHGVAGDPERAVALAVPAQGEADHVADDRVAERRAVATGRRGDLDRRPAGASSVVVAQGSSPRALPAEAPGARDRGHHGAGRRQQARPAASRLSSWWSWLSRTASIGPNSSAATLGPGELVGRRAPAEPVVAARRVEGRVGEQAPALDLDQGRGPADVRDPDGGHSQRLSRGAPRCSTDAGARSPPRRTAPTERSGSTSRGRATAAGRPPATPRRRC